MERVRVQYRPRLLSDNGPSYLSAQFGSWLAEHEVTHTRGQPYHPMTQGKIERYHRSMKKQILLENYYLPGQLEQRLAEFAAHYVRCSRCEGSGGEWGTCPLCHGYGMIEISHNVRLEIPPGAQSGDRYQIDLRSGGIEKLVLDVTIIIAGGSTSN